MNSRYALAGAVVAAALAAATWSFLTDEAVGLPLLAFAAAGAPLAALLLVSGKLDRPVPVGSVVGGGTIGITIALVSHGIVFAFAYAFFFGFADEASALIDALRLDPEWTSALGSPWTILLLIELAIVAPLTEEVGKAIGAGRRLLADRPSAFLAGVAAGTGFAIVENVLYGLGSGFLGDPWEAIVIGRMLGAGVHALASGIVVLGWWEWKQQRDLGSLAVRFFTGAGVHALWNASLVVLSVTATAFDTGASFGTFTLVSLAYTAALGLLVAAALWRVTVALARERPFRPSFDARDGRVVGAWVVLSASLLVPMAVLLLTYPDFVGR